MKNIFWNANSLGKRFGRTLMQVLTVATFVLLFLTVSARGGEDARVPELPLPFCEDISAPEGHKVSFRAYALGVQIYVWTGSGWLLKAPEAVLYADAKFNGKIGTHYGGPRWEGNDGSVVLGSSPIRCTPYADSIPWLRLNATPLSEHGLFSRVTYIQRVNTVGGLVPDYSGTVVGEEVRVAYSAEYFFYRAQ